MEPRKNIRWSLIKRPASAAAAAATNANQPLKKRRQEKKVNEDASVPSAPSSSSSTSSSGTLSLFDQIKIPSLQAEKGRGAPKCPIKDCNLDCESAGSGNFRPICHPHRRAGFNAKQVREAVEKMKAAAALVKEPVLDEKEEEESAPVAEKEEEEETTALYTKRAVEAFMEKNFVESKQTLCTSFEKKIAELNAKIERLKDEEADYFASHEATMAQLRQEMVQLENEKQSVDQEQVVLVAKWTEERLALESKHRVLQAQLKEMPSKYELSIEEEITRKRLKKEDKQVQSLHLKGIEEFAKRRNELDTVRQDCQEKLDAVKDKIKPPDYTNPLLLAMNDDIVRLNCLERCLLHAMQVAEEAFRVDLGQQIEAEAAVFVKQTEEEEKDDDAMDIDATNTSSTTTTMTISSDLPGLENLIQDQIEVDLED